MDKERVTIIYKTADGKEIRVEVTTEVKELLEQSDRQIRSQRRQERQYLNFSVKTHDDSPLLPVTEDTADLLERTERDKKLHEALNILTGTQRGDMLSLLVIVKLFTEICRNTSASL